MSGPRRHDSAARVPSAPLELMSLSHARQNEKLAVSGLVRNPVSGKPVERLTAVVFLFDRRARSSPARARSVDFLKLGAGDESPFVVSLDAPPKVARYRVSFRTDAGVVPHIDRRGTAPRPKAINRSGDRLDEARRHRRCRARQRGGLRARHETNSRRGLRDRLAAIGASAPRHRRRNSRRASGSRAASS